MLFRITEVTNQRLRELQMHPGATAAFRVAIEEEIAHRLAGGQVKFSKLDSKTLTFIR